MTFPHLAARDTLARSDRGALVRMPAREYHADPCDRPALSSSVAHVLVSKSPLHAWLRHPKLGGQAGEATDATDRGTILHALILGCGPDAFEVINFDSYRTKAAQETRDELRAEGVIPVLAREFDGFDRVASAVKRELNARGILLTGESEAVAVWEEGTPAGPVLCRGMLDHLTINNFGETAVILDLKTCRSAHPRSIESHVIEYGYDVQAAAYVSAVEHVRPDLAGRVSFRWLFVEELAGYRVALTVAEPAGSMWERGRRRWARACELWANCLASNNWPAYSAEPVRVECPAWAVDGEEGS